MEIEQLEPQAKARDSVVHYFDRGKHSLRVLHHQAIDYPLSLYNREMKSSLVRKSNYQLSLSVIIV